MLFVMFSAAYLLFRELEGGSVYNLFVMVNFTLNFIHNPSTSEATCRR